jgi:hypothetical protein
MQQGPSATADAQVALFTPFFSNRLPMQHLEITERCYGILITFLDLAAAVRDIKSAEP